MLKEIPIEKIKVNPFNSRTRYPNEAIERIADSLAQNGQIVPIRVRPSSKSIPLEYELVYGHRRFYAARSLGWKAINANVEETTDEKMMEQSLVENLEREDLSDYEIAQVFQRLNTEYGKTYEQIGKMVGFSKQHISNCLVITRLFERERLLKDPQLRNSLHSITEHHARILTRILDAEKRAELVKLVAAEELSVKELANIVNRLRSWFESDSKERESKQKRVSGGDLSSQVRERVYEKIKLAQQGDFEGARKRELFDDRFHFYSVYPPLSRIEGREANERLRQIFSEVAPTFLTDVKDLKIDVFGEVALVTLTTVHRPARGALKSFSSRGTMLFVNKRGSWKIFHEHWSRLETSGKADLTASQNKLVLAQR